MPRTPKLFTKKRTIPPRRGRVTPSAEEPPISSVSEDLSTPELSEVGDPSASSLSQSSSANSSRPSTAEKKFGENVRIGYSDFQSEKSYDVINIKEFGEALAAVVRCKVCGGQVKFQVLSRIGLAANIEVSCLECRYSSMTYKNCEKVEARNSRGKTLKMYSLNLRVVYGMRVIGKGRTASRKFLAVLNLPEPPTRFESYEDVLGIAVETTSKADMKQAVLDAVEENEGDKNLTVAFDGSWQKRGHTSLNGVVTATCGETSKIIDVEMLTKFCRCKNRLLNRHDNNCTANYSGSSGAMEVEGVLRIYRRSSEQLDGVRYTRYLGDGDSKGFQAVCEEKPYGPDVEFEKIECIGHVQKRMGARLRNMKKKSGDTKLSDGKSLGGRGRLTDEAINKLQLYYGLAIRRNTDKTLAEMKKAVWSTYLHVLSTDKQPCHQFCSEEWCRYKKNQAQGIEYKHSEHFHLPSAVMQAIKPIFVSLSSPDLLKSCLHGKTQNSNESMNNVIWAYIPKRSFVGHRVLKFGTYSAVLAFNRGNIAICEVLRTLGIDPGMSCSLALKKLDQERLDKADISAQWATKEGRLKRTLAARRLEDQFAEEEDDDPAYGAGLH